MGRADSETTQIYGQYAPSEHEIQVVNDAFANPPQERAEPAASGEPTGVGERPDPTD